MDTDEHKAELLKADYEWIDLVCVDFYPLKEEIAKEGSTLESVREKTDIGGPTMVRAGGKGMRVSICDASDRPKVIEWLKAGEPDKEKFIQALSAKAEFVVGKYCAVSAGYLSENKYQSFFGERYQQLRYGENAYQTPAYLVKTDSEYPLAMHNFTIHTGNPSMINITDVDRGLKAITHIAGGMDKNFDTVPFIALGLKHGNACGASVAETTEDAITKMLNGNLKSIFGGAIITNFEITKELAELLILHNTNGKRRPLDVVVASSVTSEAIEILKRQNDRCLIMTNIALDSLSEGSLDQTPLVRQVAGGDWIEQPNHTFILNFSDKENTKYYGSNNKNDKEKENTNRDTILGWGIATSSNSNTITLVKGGMLIGNGVGQQDRVEAVELALKRATDAGHDVAGAIAVSDSFFPFPDAPEKLLGAGVSRIFATSGSINDKSTIALFENNTTSELMHIPDPLARMFFGH
jgi:phosphoribosylaminoimidazolecarboxamide formyltransferase/IMP cyclohydrolase